MRRFWLLFGFSLRGTSPLGRLLLGVWVAALGLAGSASGCVQSGRGDGCSPACSTFTECCETASGLACVDIVNDRNNCGACGMTCPAGMACVAARCQAAGDGGMPSPDSGGGSGMCSPMCPDTMRCCGMRCINRQVAPGTDGRSDPSFMNCNGCGIACDPDRASACSASGTSMPPSCRCGLFPQCSPGESCVRDPMAGGFVCVSTSTDPNNCGMIGRRCPEGHSCIAGECVCGSGRACSDGQVCCSGTCIDTRTDAMNCGMCGRACEEGQSCRAGECVCGTGPSARACIAPTMTSPGELCCSGTCVPQDAHNCGACGNACDVDQMCVYGTDLFGGMGMRWCCGMMTFPGFPAFCIPGGGGGFDAGFGLPDAGFPFP